MGRLTRRPDAGPLSARIFKVFQRPWRGAAAAVACAFALIAATPVQAAECDDAARRCGGEIKRDCLARVGAGALGVTAAAETCAAQLQAYRGCLTQAAESCGDPGGADALVAGSVGDLCAIGAWRGRVIEPGFDSYDMELEIGVRNGAPFARMRYPQLSCASRGDHLEGPTRGRILFRETVVENRGRCADGRFAVTCLADGRLHWRWFRDNGENFDAVLAR